MTLTQTMMELIRIGICPSATTEKIELNEEQAKRLFLLSKSHDMAHLVGYALNLLKVELSEEVARKFQQEQTMAVYRYEQQNYELEEICRVLEEAKIEFVPLKGSVIRDLYPQAWLRTSCDIDILVHKEDLERATKCVQEQLSYGEGTKKGNDISFFAPSGVHLELHFALVESGALDKGNAVLKRAWEYTDARSEKCYQKVFSEDMFYYFHILHMAKHFTYGGCGVKPFLDLHILENIANIDQEKAKNLLVEGGLWEFAVHAKELADVWFAGEEPTELTRQMEEYILQAGTYGTFTNKVAMQQARRGGKFKYTMSRIFMPYEQLKAKYPSLGNRKWLIPFYQIRRWFSALFAGRLKEGKKELKEVNQTSKKNHELYTNMLKELNLYSK